MKRKIITELDRDMIIGQIKRLDLKKIYTVEITEKKVKRSLSQNSLYWLWLTCIEAETGNDKGDLHEVFKVKFLDSKAVELFGTVFLRSSTTNLDTKQFKEYLDKIQLFASVELAIILPDPEDLRWEEFYTYYSDRL
jgi:hypothetical protein